MKKLLLKLALIKLRRARVERETAAKRDDSLTPRIDAREFFEA